MEVQPLILVHIIKITTTISAAISTTSSRIATSTTAIQWDYMKVTKNSFCLAFKCQLNETYAPLSTIPAQ